MQFALANGALGNMKGMKTACTLELALSYSWEPFCPHVNKPCLPLRW